MMFPAPSPKTLCLLGLLLIVCDPGSARSGTGERMANAMARMMEAMGLFDSGPTSRDARPAASDPMSMMSAGAPWGTGPSLGMPWGNPFPYPAGGVPMPGFMEGFGPRPDGVWSLPWSPSPLEGVWEGRGGELLIVQGDRFRIYSVQMRPMDGLVQIEGDRLALYDPRQDHAQPFEFAESEGRLAMRDLHGQLYLYRRLRLDEGAEPRSPPPNPGSGGR